MIEKDLTFCLLLPTLNEVEGLRVVLPQIDRSLFKEIIVVDGGSTDGTMEFCREAGLIVLRQPGRGIPDAEEHGYRHMTADAMILFTPDGNSLAQLLPEMCQILRQGHDIVVASRYLGGATSDDDDMLTAFGNKMFTVLVNILFRAQFTDVLVGLRAYTRQAIERMGLPTMSQESSFRQRYYLVNSWELGASIRAARLKLNIKEIPGPEPKRIGGVRKLSVVRNGLGALTQVFYDFLFFRGRK